MLCCFGCGRTKGTHAENSELQIHQGAEIDPRTAGRRKEVNKNDARLIEHGPWLNVTDNGEVELTEVNVKAAAAQFRLYERDVEHLIPKGEEEALRAPARIEVRSQAIVISLGALRLVVGLSEAVLISVPAVGDPPQAALPYSDNSVVRDLISRLRISSHNPDSECLVDKGLPFLLVVLEWALSTAVKHLSDEALSFERQVLPLLEGLAMKVTRKNLIQLRHLKAQLHNLTARSSSIREELHYLLDDDEALLSIYEIATKPSATHDERTEQAEGMRRAKRPSRGRRSRLRRSQRRSPTVSSSSPVDFKALSECRSLVECYLMQVEVACNTVKSVASSSQNTECMVRLNLKHQRVRLGPI